MKRSSTLVFVAASAIAGWMSAAVAYAQDSTGNTGSQNQGSAASRDQGNTASQNERPMGAMTGKLMTATATVENVDTDKRELTLKSNDNKPFTINVPENVTRLDNVKPGDKVRVSFYESVAVSLAKPGEAQQGRQSSTMTQRTPGALPGGGTVRQVTTTAKITNVSPSKDELTIEGPGGKANTIKVEDPAVQSQLSHLKAGDKIQTTYTQAMATSVTPAKRM